MNEMSAGYRRKPRTFGITALITERREPGCPYRAAVELARSIR